MTMATRRKISAARSPTMAAGSKVPSSGALVGLSALLFLIELLQYKECLLFFTMLGYQPFAVEIVLNSRQRAPRAAKIFQNPGCNAAQKWDALQHGNLVLIEILLVLFAPARERIAMVAKARVPPKFAHDEWLVVG